MELARAAWPNLDVPDEIFVAYAAERSAAPTADLYLACACTRQVPGAAAAFALHVTPAIHAALGRLGARDISDDVTQIVMDMLLVGGRIARYAGRGSLRGWVRVIAMREALRLLRARDRRGAQDLCDAIAPNDHELDYLKREYRAQFRTAFLEAVAALDRKQRIALRMNVVDGRSIDEIAAVFGAHRSSAARWLASARAMLVEITRSHLMAKLRLPAAEVDSVIRLVGSNVDTTLTSLLRSYP